MGSVIDAIECPKCKYENASIETYYKTGNEEIFCERCGYSSEYNAFGKGKLKKSGGKGVIFIGFSGGGTLGQFSNKYLNHLKAELKKDTIKNGYGEKPREIYYTKLVKGEWKKFYLIKLIEVSSGNDKEENKHRVV